MTLEIRKPSSFATLSRDFYYANCLIDEVISQNMSEVKWLLESKKAKADIVVPERGAAALHLLAGLENEDFSTAVTQQVLLMEDTDPNVRSEEGLTPLHVAAMYGRCRVLQVLLTNGADPTLMDYRLLLDAEEYALRERQWRAHSVLTSNIANFKSQTGRCEGRTNYNKYPRERFEVLSYSKHPWKKNKEFSSSIKHPHQTSKENSDTCSYPRDIDVANLNSFKAKLSKVISRNRDMIVNNYNNMPSETLMKVESLGCQSKESNSSVKSNLDQEKIPSSKSSRKIENENEPSETRTSQRKTNRKRGGSEMYFCEFEEKLFSNKGYSRSRSSMNSQDDSFSSKIPSNKMLCKMSRIFLFMLRKRNTCREET